MSKKNGAGLFDETVGPWGARVRVKETRPGGKVVLLFPHRDPDKSGYDREPLNFKVRNPDGTLNEEAARKARNEARRLSDLLDAGTLPDDLEPDPDEVTFGELFDAFREHEIPHKSERRRKELRRHLEGLERFLGRGMLVPDFTARDWEAFARQRIRGEIDLRGRPVPEEERKEVSPTTAAYDLSVLRQVCSWGTGFRVPEEEERPLPDGRRFLLEFDPTRDNRCTYPKARNPARPVCSDERFRKLLRASEDVRIGRGETSVRPPLRELLVVARGTGRRIGAIVGLRWADWRPDRGRHGELRWRAEEDKIGREWRAPVPRAVREALEGLHRRRLAESGVPGPEAPIFPALEADGHVRVDVTRGWLLEAEEIAGLDHPEGFGWHALRRAWATKRKDLPLKDVAAAGGWADTQALRICYQHADPETTEAVVLHEDPFTADGEEGGEEEDGD